MMIAVLFIFAGCRKYQIRMEETNDVNSSNVVLSVDSNDVDIKSSTVNFQEYLNVAEIIENLEEEPSWTVENFNSVENFKNFCSKLSIPKTITDIFDRHEKNNTLNSKGDVELYIDKRYSSIAEIYKDNDEVYRINYWNNSLFNTKDSIDTIGQGVFKNGNNMVIVSVLKFQSTEKYLGDEYTVFCRLQISTNGEVHYSNEHIDTALLIDKNFKRVMICPEFTLLFYPTTNEFVCVKDSQEIGPRTKVDSDDLCGFTWQTVNSEYIAVNCKDIFVIPVILKCDKGVSFHIVHLNDANNYEKSNMELHATINNVRYPIMSENEICYIENAIYNDYNYNIYKYRKFKDNLLDYEFVDEISWIGSLLGIQKFLTVESDEIKVIHHDIEFDEFRYSIYDGTEYGVCVVAYNENIELWRRIRTDNYVIQLIEEGKYMKFAVDDECYDIPSYDETLRVLDELGVKSET